MCGLAGFVSLRGEDAAAIVRGALPALVRRGPDGEGVAVWPGVALGHRRLAILDLSPAGAQPMLSPDGQTGIVFNGCIYNFQEIRAELEHAGRKFRSHCDTEVLLEGYREWGIDGLLPKLRGMFAFAIWDQPRRTLTLARDRLGVKPLVYAAGPRGIAFASTFSALALAGFAGGLDPQAVLEFLEFGFVTDERSIYAGLHKLPPAGVLEWSEGRIRQRTWWDLPAIDEAAPLRFEEAVEETERLLLESVRLRLVSDVPVGALLSAGIDSTLICWALGRLNAPVEAYTVSAPGEPDDESAGAAEVARALGVPHRIVPVSGDEPFPIEELIEAYDEPFASQSALGMLRVCRAVKSAATVLLTGDGGDDVFLGYSFFANAWRATRLARRLPVFAPGMWRAARPLAQAIGAAAPPVKSARNFLDYATGGVGAYARGRIGLPYFEQRGLLGERLAGRRLPEREVPASLAAARRLLPDVLEFHRRHHFTSEFMVKVDRGAGHHSIEARAPLLDHRLWEFAWRLPPAIRLHGGRLKAILREIVRRRVGPEVAFRRKQGFTIPVERWLCGKWSAHLDELRGDTLLVRDGWLRREPLDAAVREAQERGDVQPQLWFTLVLEHWLRRREAARAAQQAARSPVEA
jgi:asparagine synthase (glutamine-hydrolysing)